jgi:hypothetical protein
LWSPESVAAHPLDEVQMTITTDEFDDGEHRKRLAHERLEVYRASLITLARRQLVEHLLSVSRGTIDDIRDRVTIPNNVDPRYLGAVPAGLAAMGIITAVGIVTSKRPETHGRLIRQWSIADRRKAETFLASNPLPVP